MSCRSTQGNSGLTSYAQACSGASDVEVSRIFHALKREGAAAVAPSGAEVEAFLEAQEFQVRNDESLASARKNSILRRLHASLVDARNRILPDGATFHAWKNILTESWARARRKIAAVAMLSAFGAGVTGCGGAAVPDHAANAPTASRPVASALASPSVNDQKVTVTPVATFTGPAAVNFSQADLQSAYASATYVAGTLSFQESMMRAKPGEPVNFDCVDPYLILAAQDAWDGQVAKMKAGDKEATANVGALTLYNVANNEATYRADRSTVSNTKISDPIMTIAPNGNLTVAVTAKFDMHIVQDQKNVMAHITRTSTYVFERNVGATAATTPWLVSGWRAKITGNSGFAPDPT